MTKNTINKNCPICENVDVALVTKGLRDAEDIRVLKCSECSAVFLSTFEHIVPEFYSNNGMFQAVVNYTKWLKGSEVDDKRRFKFLKSSLKNKTLLDIGCGAGGFLSLAKKSAKEAYGVEINESVHSFLCDNGINVCKDISEFQDEKFDVITMFHVLEHIKDPVDFLKNVALKLKKDGKIIIEVPNDDDALLSLYNCEAFKKHTYWSCHLYSYNKKVLKRIMHRTGLKIKYIKYFQRYGLFNHLNWIFSQKPNGHSSSHFMNNRLNNKLYGYFLGFLGKTDTIILSVNKKARI